MKIVLPVWPLDMTTSVWQVVAKRPQADKKRTVTPLTVVELLATARANLTRLSPDAADRARRQGTVLVDIRCDAQIARDGTIPGALVIGRNVLEWRLDPAGEHRHPQAPGVEEQVIVVCHEGYQSSLVAATLQQFGFARATDLDGGFQAWRSAGLPVDAPVS